MKESARGIPETRRGYTLHIDMADCGAPLSVGPTPVSLHDS